MKKKFVVCCLGLLGATFFLASAQTVNADMGAWSGLQNTDTTYTAATDGFVTATSLEGGDQDCRMQIESPVGVVRQTANPNNDGVQITETSPVRKGDTWKVSYPNTGCGTVADYVKIYWIPYSPPVTIGTFIINATKDGIAWDSPPFAEVYDAPFGVNQPTTLDPPQTITDAPVGTYTVRSVTPPAGVTFQNINGSPLPYSQTLTAGGTLFYTYNFVTAAPPVPTLVVSPSSASVAIGGTQQFNAIYDSDGAGPAFPLAVTNSSLWSSSNNSIATITSTGMATGNAVGSATITAQYAGLTASASLTVAAPVPTLDVIPSSASVAIGGTQQFSAIYDPDGSGPNPTQDVTAIAAWSTPDASKITVSNGLVTRVGNGYAEVNASYSGLSDFASVFDPARLRVIPPSANLKFGETIQLSACYNPNMRPASDCSGSGDQNVTTSSEWSPTKSSRATVDNVSSKGLVTAGSSAGLVNISASYAGLTERSRIRVIAPSLVVSCSASPVSAIIGESVTWTAIASGGAGSYSYSWSGSSPLGGKTGNPVSVIYVTPGIKNGGVSVVSGGSSVTSSCGNNVSVSAGNQPPTAVNLGVSVSPGGADSLTDNCKIISDVSFSWTYSDPENDSQAAIRVQVDNNSNFSSPEFDSGKTSISSPSYSLPAGSLGIGTYYWRLKLWDSQDKESNWFNGLSSFTVSSVQAVNFSWTPNIPLVNQLVSFDSSSIIPISSYAWIFQTGSPAESALMNPQSKFLSAGVKKVKLSIVSDIKSCSIVKDVVVGGGGPL